MPVNVCKHPPIAPGVWTMGGANKGLRSGAWRAGPQAVRAWAEPAATTRKWRGRAACEGAPIDRYCLRDSTSLLDQQGLWADTRPMPRLPPFRGEARRGPNPEASQRRSGTRRAAEVLWFARRKPVAVRQGKPAPQRAPGGRGGGAARTPRGPAGASGFGRGVSRVTKSAACPLNVDLRDACEPPARSRML